MVFRSPHIYPQCPASQKALLHSNRNTPTSHFGGDKISSVRSKSGDAQGADTTSSTTGLQKILEATSGLICHGAESGSGCLVGFSGPSGGAVLKLRQDVCSAPGSSGVTQSVKTVIQSLHRAAYYSCDQEANASALYKISLPEADVSISFHRLSGECWVLIRERDRNFGSDRRQQEVRSPHKGRRRAHAPHQLSVAQHLATGSRSSFCFLKLSGWKKSSRWRSAGADSNRVERRKLRDEGNPSRAPRHRV